MKEPSSKKQSDNWHWWDFYLVRYLLPTLVGACIIVWLFASDDSSIPNLSLILDRSSEKSISFAKTSLALLGIGFVFCYIASFPVLVLHATRDSFNKYLRNITLLFFIISIFSILILIFMSFIDTIIAFLITVLFSILQFTLIFASFNNQFPYLRKLSTQRYNEQTDIVDSYKHLREHGNAALIIICELFLAALCRPIFFDGNHVSLGLENFRLLGLLIGIWSLPAACIYFFGHHLEYQFVNNDNAPPEKSKICLFFSKIRNLFSCVKQIFRNTKK